MKKIIILLITFLITINSEAQQQTLDIFNKNGEPGKCYISSVLKKNTQDKVDTFYFEVKQPIYESKVSKVSELLKEKNKLGISDKHFVVEVVEAVTELRIYKGFDSYGRKLEDALCFCVTEIPAKYQTITFSNKDSIYDMLIVHKVLKENGKIVLITKKKALESKAEIIQVPTNYSKWQEYLVIACGRNNRVKDLQKALIREGYSCKIDGILNQETKDAVIQFQKNNNLPQGRIDVKTLRKLNLE